MGQDSPGLPALPDLPAQYQRRVEPDAKHRSLWQLDILPFGRGDRAAAADQDAGECTLRAAEDRAENRTGACADPDLLLLSSPSRP
jgi:hypothetical protein